MSDDQLRATGIEVYENYGEWSISLKFFDDKHADETSIKGELHLSYYVGSLPKGIDTLIASATKMGIEFVGVPSQNHKPMLYYRGDGESIAHPPPANWKEIINTEAARLGWRGYS